jgi:hypothetical protein
MTTEILSTLKHQLGDENPQDDFETLQSMTQEETLAYVDDSDTNTTSGIIEMANQLR